MAYVRSENTEAELSEGEVVIRQLHDCARKHDVVVLSPDEARAMAHRLNELADEVEPLPTLSALDALRRRVEQMQNAGPVSREDIERTAMALAAWSNGA